MKTVCDTRYNWFRCGRFGEKAATGGFGGRWFLGGVVSGENGRLLVDLDAWVVLELR